MTNIAPAASQNALALLVHLYANVGGNEHGSTSLTPADADTLGISWDALRAAQDELVSQTLVDVSRPGEGRGSVSVTARGCKVVRSKLEFGRAVTELRAKSESLPPAMREEADAIIQEVETQLRQHPHNKPVLKLLLGGLTESFGSHIPEIATLLSQIGL